MPKVLPFIFEENHGSCVTEKRFTWDSLEGARQNLGTWEGIGSTRCSIAVCWQLSKEGAHETTVRGQVTLTLCQVMCRMAVLQHSLLLGTHGQGRSTASPCWPCSTPWRPLPQSLGLPTSPEVTVHPIPLPFLKWPSCSVHWLGTLSFSLLFSY